MKVIYFVVLIEETIFVIWSEFDKGKQLNISFNDDYYELIWFISGINFVVLAVPYLFTGLKIRRKIADELESVALTVMKKSHMNGNDVHDGDLNDG